MVMGQESIYLIHEALRCWTRRYYHSRLCRGKAETDSGTKAINWYWYADNGIRNDIVTLGKDDASRSSCHSTTLQILNAPNSWNRKWGPLLLTVRGVGKNNWILLTHWWAIARGNDSENKLSDWWRLTSSVPNHFVFIPTFIFPSPHRLSQEWRLLHRPWRWLMLITVHLPL